MCRIIDENGVLARTDRANWQGALETVEQEIRRAVSFGFLESEFRQTSAALLSGLGSASEAAATRQSSGLADRIVNQLSGGDVLMHPSDELVLMERLIQQLSPKDCHDAVRQMWNTNDVRIFLSSNEPLDDDASRTILAAYASSQQRPVAPPSDTSAHEFAYTQFGAPGKVVQRVDVSDLGIIQATFANNVRVNIKPTTFKDNAVQLSVRIGGGLLEAPMHKPGLPIVAQATLISGGLKAHDMAELNRVLSDKVWTVSFSVLEDAFQFQGASSTNDLETALRVMAAYVTEPALRPEALEQFQSRLTGLYADLEHTPEGMLQREVEAFTHSEDLRFGFPAQDVLRQRTLAEVQSWLERPFREGYMEIGIVGDVDPDTALRWVAQTLGALPTRSAVKPNFARERTVSLPTIREPHRIRFTSETPRAATVMIWPAADGRDIHRARRLNILSKILNDRLRVTLREELGEAYTPIVLVESSETFKNYGYLASFLTVDPKKVNQVSATVREI
ncbi:MAG TPA: insulinase family protein, partial [Pirellulaceae bacterium]